MYQTPVHIVNIRFQQFRASLHRNHLIVSNPALIRHHAMLRRCLLSLMIFSFKIAYLYCFQTPQIRYIRAIHVGYLNR